MRAWVTKLWHCRQGWAGGQGARASHPQQAPWDGKAQPFWEMLCPVSPSLGTLKELEQEDCTQKKRGPHSPQVQAEWPTCPSISSSILPSRKRALPGEEPPAARPHPGIGRIYPSSWGFPGGASGKEPAYQCRRHERHGFDPWVGTIPWRREWQLTAVFFPGESPWIEEPGRLQSIGPHRVRLDWSDLARMHAPISSGWSAVQLKEVQCRHSAGGMVESAPFSL